MCPVPILSLPSSLWRLDSHGNVIQLGIKGMLREAASSALTAWTTTLSSCKTLTTTPKWRTSLPLFIMLATVTRFGETLCVNASWRYWAAIFVYVDSVRWPGKGRYRVRGSCVFACFMMAMIRIPEVRGEWKGRKATLAINFGCHEDDECPWAWRISLI